MLTTKERLIHHLKQYETQERINKHKFKEKAYAKAIYGIQTAKKIESLRDVENIQGIGESIYEKCKAFFTSSHSETNKEVEAIQLFQQVHGIGPVKATELVKTYKLYTLDDLRSRIDLLQPIQKIGLKYVEDSLHRIPRSEMDKHAMYVTNTLHTASSNQLMGCLVGSYRRKKESSGDIDMLITYNHGAKHVDTYFETFITTLIKHTYIVDILSRGKKKCMAFCKLPLEAHVRRLDLLLTPPEEFVTSLLYFTGSQEFNIKMRTHALQLGYTLNEHSLTPLDKCTPTPPLFKTEKECFDFLHMEYTSPEHR